jgi:hypothetical protein
MSPPSHTLELEEQTYTHVPEPSPSLSADETSTTETVLDTPLTVPDDVELVFGKGIAPVDGEYMVESETTTSTMSGPSRQRTSHVSNTNDHAYDSATQRRASWDLSIPAQTKLEGLAASREVASDSGWRSSTRHETKPSVLYARFLLLVNPG